jgi:NitT/TauT family transport system substrate-binding protein
LSFLGAVLLTATASAIAADRIRVGGLTDTMLVGIGKGWFEEAGLKVEITDLPNVLQYPNLLASDSIDVMDGFLAATFWNMIDAGAKFKIIGGSAVMVAAQNGEPARNPRAYLARKDLYEKGEIRSVDDFVDRKIADFVPVPAKGKSSPFLIAHKIFGEKYKQIDWIFIPNESNILAALETGEIAGARMTTRWGKIAVARGLAVEVAKETDYVPLAQVRVVVAREDFARENPDVLARFMRVRLRAQRYLAEVQKGKHDDEYKAMAAKHSRFPPDIALQLAQELKFTEELAEKDMMEQQQHFVSQGIQKRVVPLAEVVDRRYLKTAKQAR